MGKKYEWLEKKTPRSVDQLKLWPLNPRLDLEEDHVKNSDYAEDFIQEASDKKNFFALINSIANDGFIPADPIVVWQNEENQKFYVAEGNRRILALKLLRNPSSAPRSIRSYIRKASNKINLAEIEKILVNVAPTFEDAEWYINQRNSSSSLQKPWTRVQQQRWILELYNKYNGDFEILMSKTKLSKSELESFFRILEIRDFVKNPIVRGLLTDDEYNKVRSDRFPITILERFFNFVEVKEKWGIEYNGIEVKIISNKKSFYNAFAKLIKRIVNESENKINTRFKKENLEDILGSLPQVDFDQTDDHLENSSINNTEQNQEDLQVNQNNNEENSNDGSSNERQSKTIQAMKGNPSRNKMVLPIYNLKTDNYRLDKLFNNEFQKISVATYPNSVASALRVFLDLAVLNYIDSNDLRTDISRQYGDFREVTLKKRLTYLKDNKLTNKPKTIATQLLEEKNHYSLSVLNGYVHSNDTHHLDKRILNGFWDFLFPLFEEFLDIREINV